MGEHKCKNKCMLCRRFYDDTCIENKISDFILIEDSVLDEQINYRKKSLEELNELYNKTKDAKLIDKIKMIKLEIETLKKGKINRDAGQTL